MSKEVEGIMKGLEITGESPLDTVFSHKAATGRGLGAKRYTDIGRQILSPKGPRSLD